MFKVKAVCPKCGEYEVAVDSGVYSDHDTVSCPTCGQRCRITSATIDRERKTNEDQAEKDL